jgi:hypothetical protein
MFGCNPNIPLNLNDSNLTNVTNDISTSTERRQYGNELKDKMTKIYQDVRNHQVRIAEYNTEYIARKLTPEKYTNNPIQYDKNDTVLLWEPNVVANTIVKGAGMQKISNKWTGPHIIEKRVSNTNYIIRRIPAHTLENVHTNRLIPYHPFSDDIPDPAGSYYRRVLEEGIGEDMNMEEAYPTDIVLKDQLVIIPMEVNEYNKLPFSVGRVIEMDEEDHITVQWYGNVSENIRRPFLPAWIDNDRRHYYRTKPQHITHKPWTNLINNTPLNKYNVAYAGINLNQDSTIPVHILSLLKQHPLIKLQV